MFTTSQTTTKLDDALAKVQGELNAAIKDKTNPHFNSKYADINAVWEACRGPLAKHLVSVSQWPIHSTDNRVHLVTRIAHAGEWLMAEFSIPTSKQDAHGYGSATTYIKRFALCAALGVITDDEEQRDDDGNASSIPEPQERAQTPAKGTLKPMAQAKPLTDNRTPSDNQLKRLFAISKQANWTDEELKRYLHLAFGVDSTKKLTMGQYNLLCDSTLAQGFKLAIGALPKELQEGNVNPNYDPSFADDVIL